MPIQQVLTNSFTFDPANGTLRDSENVRHCMHISFKARCARPLYKSALVLLLAFLGQGCLVFAQSLDVYDGTWIIPSEPYHLPQTSGILQITQTGGSWRPRIHPRAMTCFNSENKPVSIVSRTPEKITLVIDLTQSIPACESMTITCKPINQTKLDCKWPENRALILRKE